MGASVTEPPKRYVGAWIGRQPELFPSLDEPLDPLTAKAVLNIPTTAALIERLQVDRSLRRICGWERRSDVPGESTFGIGPPWWTVCGLGYLHFRHDLLGMLLFVSDG